MRFIECTAVAEDGSGNTYAASVRADLIAVILDLPEGMMNGARATVRFPGLEEAMLTAESREELMLRIAAAPHTTA